MNCLFMRTINIRYVKVRISVSINMRNITMFLLIWLITV